MRLLIVLLAASLTSEPRKAVERPSDLINCEDVRQFVAQNGRAHAIAWALRQGASIEDLRKAARCLKQGDG